MRITARFNQGVQENKRYVIDYTLDLATGETVVSMATPTITTPQGQSDANSPTLVIDNIVIGPGGLQVVFFASGGVAPGTYFVNFLATTSIGQDLECVVAFNIASFTT